MVRHRLSLSSIVAAALILCPAAGAVAAAREFRAQTPDSFEHQESDEPSDSSPCVNEEHTVSAVARKTQRVCGGAPAAEALLAVGLQPVARQPYILVLFLVLFYCNVTCARQPMGRLTSVGERERERLLMLPS